ncbi:uncharacterized protein [Dermacentor albipictus]|uniref:uncharacterized protein n=1 Tax=Dermacentor albipictus TaxID=60249 RepID=UPI0038FCE15A
MADADNDVLTTMSVLVIVCSLLLRRRRAQKARRRRFWVHPCWRYRDVEGQANALLPRLRARDEGFFRDVFRMPPSSFDTLFHLVRPVIERQDTPFRRSISTHDRLAMTVRFLANGDTMRSLSFNFLTGRSTAGMIVRETCAALWEILQPIYVRFPQTAEEWKKIATDMLVEWNFPNCIGCIDGKHESIECPANSGSRNLNYKKSFSTVLMAICDAHYRFVYVDVGHYGGESDGGVFLRTKLMRILGERRFGIPPAATVGSAGLIPYLMQPRRVVGDEAFPLKPYLVRPYPPPEMLRRKWEAGTSAKDKKGKHNGMALPLVDMDGICSCHTGLSVDYKKPCTASPKKLCHVCKNAAAWNGFFLNGGLELREVNCEAPSLLGAREGATIPNMAMA